MSTLTLTVSTSGIVAPASVLSPEPLDERSMLTEAGFEPETHVIDGAVAKSVTADSLLKDLSLLAAAGARDAALAFSTCITAGQAIANLDLPHPDQAGKQ